MAKKVKKSSGEIKNTPEKLLERLIEVTENSMVINLILKGIPQQEVRKMVQCDMRRITKLIKPVKKYIKKFLKEEKNSNSIG